MFSIAWPIHVEDLGVIDESVDDSVSDGVIGKDLVEFSEGDVGGRNDSQSLVMPCGNNLEEQIRCLSVQGHVTELIDDEDLRSSISI